MATIGERSSPPQRRGRVNLHPVAVTTHRPGAAQDVPRLRQMQIRRRLADVIDRAPYQLGDPPIVLSCREAPPVRTNNRPPPPGARPEAAGPRKIAIDGTRATFTPAPPRRGIPATPARTPAPARSLADTERHTPAPV